MNTFSSSHYDNARWLNKSTLYNGNVILTVELNIAVRFAEGVLRYAFVAAIIGHRDWAYRELHVHFVYTARAE